MSTKAWLHEGRQINFHPRPSGVYQKHELLYSNDVEAPRNKAHQGRPGGSGGKASACNSGNLGSYPWVGKIPWRREWLPTPVFLPGEFHGQRSLAGYSPWGCKELDTSEQLSLLPSSLSLLVVPTMSEPPLSLPGQHLPFHPPIPKSPWTGLKSFLKLAPPCMQPSLCSESEA